MIVLQFFVKGLAHSSYLLGGKDRCVIVDPQRDVDIYLQTAESMALEIAGVLETHLHADFISGHMELAAKAGARIYAPKSARCRFDNVALAEGDTFEIEDMMISVLETPGHTPEHISYVAKDLSRGNEPAAVFCGDTLFVGDVGRPDLFPGKAKELAGLLYTSLYEKIMKLPDFCEVYPAHGAGSLCGRAMAAKRTSTIGYERLYNRALQIRDRSEFIESLTTNMPPAPDHFSRCSRINGQGPALISELPRMKALKAAEFKKLIEQKDTVVLDIRSYEAFGGQHVPGAWNIDLGGNFSTFAGWMLPADKDIALVGNSFEQAQQAVVGLRRVGLDKTIAYLDGGMFGWATAGLASEHVCQLSAYELFEMTKGGERLSLVDVRAPREYADSHIEGAVNIPVGDLRTRFSQLDGQLRMVTICSTGHRSSLAASILQQHGFKKVCNLAGGMTGYSAAGLAPRCALCVAPHLPAFSVQQEAAVAAK